MEWIIICGLGVLAAWAIVNVIREPGAPKAVKREDITTTVAAISAKVRALETNNVTLMKAHNDLHHRMIEAYNNCQERMDRIEADIDRLQKESILDAT